MLALSLLGFLGETHNGFDLTQHSVALEDIHSGGPPRDGIPAIIHPHFVSVDDTTFLQENDRILGNVERRFKMIWRECHFSNRLST